MQDSISRSRAAKDARLTLIVSRCLRMRTVGGCCRAVASFALKYRCAITSFTSSRVMLDSLTPANRDRWTEPVGRRMLPSIDRRLGG